MSKYSTPLRVGIPGSTQAGAPHPAHPGQGLTGRLAASPPQGQGMTSHPPGTRPGFPGYAGPGNVKLPSPGLPPAGGAQPQHSPGTGALPPSAGLGQHGYPTGPSMAQIRQLMLAKQALAGHPAFPAMLPQGPPVVMQNITPPPAPGSPLKGHPTSRTTPGRTPSPSDRSAGSPDQNNSAAKSTNFHNIADLVGGSGALPPLPGRPQCLPTSVGENEAMIPQCVDCKKQQITPTSSPRPGK